MQGTDNNQNDKLITISDEFRKRMRETLDALASRVLQSQPDDPIPYMIQYFEDIKGIGAAPLTPQERSELESLKQQHKQLQEKISSKKNKQFQEDKPQKSNCSDSSDSEGEEVADLPIAKSFTTGQKARTSVSAEVYGKFNMKEAFIPNVVPKTQEEKSRIQERIVTAFMFKALNKTDMGAVIDAMAANSFEAGQTVIKEGEAGDCVYLVESGELDCSKVIEGEEKFLKTYTPGMAFGELALLYNAPRAATIKAKTACVLYALDRQTFNHIVKEASQRKRDKYEDFLQTVPILQTLDTYERSKIADAVQEEVFKKGEKVITEGGDGEDIYLLISGQAVATKSLKPGEEPVEVKKYGKGDYFGELALLKHCARAANVVASGEEDLHVARLDRLTFKRLLGPLDTILMRNMQAYQSFM